jgi:hypothetical protein
MYRSEKLKCRGLQALFHFIELSLFSSNIISFLRKSRDIIVQ